MKGFIIHQRKFKRRVFFLNCLRGAGTSFSLAKGVNRPKSTLGPDLQPLRLLEFTLHERSSLLS